jgi:non-ribosomal peptide synthetase component E (peptide arylation enzyme)
MAIETILTERMIALYTQAGLWKNKLWTDYIHENAERLPSREAIVDRSNRITFKQWKDNLDQMAVNLLRLGIKTGDRVGLQLPNWWEFICLRFALHRIGAVCIPLPPDWRQREIGYILRETAAKAYFIPQRFRNFDYTEMADILWKELPQLKYVIVVDGKLSKKFSKRMESFESLLSTVSEGEKERLDKISTDPNEVDIIASSSGSTAFPKLVVRTPNQVGCMLETIAERHALTPEDTVFAMAPITRGVGYLAVGTALVSGAKLILLERFSPKDALKWISQERVTVALAVPTEIIKILSCPDISKYDFESLRCFTNGGAPLPPSAAEALSKKLNCKVLSGYGAVEGGVPTWTSLSDPAEKAYNTVGRPLPGMEIAVFDEAGRSLPPGETGEVVYRGANCSLGFYRNTEDYLRLFDPQGWFFSGDLGQIDRDGYLKIVGRKKEIIIRGGANISPQEVEEMLQAHPKIEQVAVVKMPDKIMGEKACAYVVPKEGQIIDFDEMIFFLKEKNLATYKLPERLEVVKALPMTASEKVLKKELEKDIALKLEREGMV